MDTQTQIDRLIELAIVQRTDLKKLVSELPQLREHLSAEIERTFDEFEPQLRTELEEFCATRADDKHAKLSAELGAKIESFSRALQDSAQAKFSALLKEREENVRVAKEAEAKIAEHAASLPSAVKEIVDAELSRFPRAGEIDQLRKEFQEPRGLNPRGKWQSGEVYNKLDLVAYNGDSFVSNTNGNRERPNRASEEWTLNAARGNSGGGGGIASLTDILPIPSSGQILGSEGPNYTPKTLVAGANITITETPTQITITGDEGQIELQDGTAAAPSLFFVNDMDTGLFRPGANLIGIAAGGQAAITIGATEMTLNVTDVQLGGDLSIDNDTLFIDKANSRVGIGTSTPEASLVVRSQGSTNSRSILVEHNDNTTAFSQAKFIGARSRGSHGSPSAVLANDSLVSFNGRGYKTNAWSNTVGGFYVYAAENWTNTATGSFAAFRLAATGGTTVSEVARLTSTGNLLVGTATDSSNGKLQLASHTTSAGGIGFGTDASLFRSADNVISASGALRALGDASSVALYITADKAIRNAGIQYLDATTSFIFRTTGSFTTALTIDSSQNATFAGRAIVNSTTASTSTTTGSLVLSGGLGVAGAAFVGGNSSIVSSGSLTDGTITLRNTDNTSSQARHIIFSRGNGTGAGAVLFTEGNASNGVNVFGVRLLAVDRAKFSATGLSLLDTTASTSTTTGALQVAGGVGVAGSGYFGASTFVVPAVATSAALFVTTNTGGSFFSGLDNSTGSNFGAGNYAGVLWNTGNNPVVIATNNTARLTVAAGGAVAVSSTTASTSTTTGALQVAGGVGVAGAAYIGGDVVLGTNPGGAERLRIGGSIRVNGAVISNSTDTLTVANNLSTGAGTFSGAIAIGNTVNTVSPTSPNRTITMVVGGTTYYIAAKTTND